MRDMTESACIVCTDISSVFGLTCGLQAQLFCKAWTIQDGPPVHCVHISVFYIICSVTIGLYSNTSRNVLIITFLHDPKEIFTL